MRIIQSAPFIQTFFLLQFLCGTGSTALDSGWYSSELEQRLLRTRRQRQPLTAAPTSAPSTLSDISSAAAAPSTQSSKSYLLSSWSLVLPLLSVTFLCWALRQHGARICCMDERTTNGIPDEIIIIDDDDDESVVGDNKQTDVELQPWKQIRPYHRRSDQARSASSSSSTWHEPPADPVLNVSLRSDWTDDGCSESPFTLMTT